MRVRLTPCQSAVFEASERFRVLAAGRRFGKTYLSQVELCRAAWAPDRVAWYVAPTCKQAKAVAWPGLKQMTKPYWAKKPNETDLTIALSCGGVIAVRGADNYDNLRGLGLDFVVLDEFASMAKEAWTEVIRPMLADRRGRALFIGTPKGHNHFHDLFDAAHDRPGWAAFHFTTEEGGIVSAEELASFAREMDERVYAQEFRASFENLASGRVYHAFDRSHIREVSFDPRLTLCWTLDFNIDPACSLLCQIVPPASVGGKETVHVLDEIVLPDSNTLAVCEEFNRRTEAWLEALDSHQVIEVHLYGDATGERRQSSASQSDWQIVRDFFTRHSGDYRKSIRVPNSNPEVRNRINAVNALICSATRERRLVVSPQCKQLIRDLEQVVWKTDANGNALGVVDNSDKMRTHLSDALGYLVVKKYALAPKVGLRRGSIFC